MRHPFTARRPNVMLALAVMTLLPVIVGGLAIFGLLQVQETALTEHRRHIEFLGLTPPEPESATAEARGLASFAYKVRKETDTAMRLVGVALFFSVLLGGQFVFFLWYNQKRRERIARQAEAVHLEHYSDDAK